MHILPETGTVLNRSNNNFITL